uniref:Uncharacterized protein n=1 Tax=Romanomermis culicivorax TaxID=13658 RepID=A0A915KMG2_ROMCU
MAKQGYSRQKRKKQEAAIGGRRFRKRTPANKGSAAPLRERRRCYRWRFLTLTQIRRSAAEYRTATAEHLRTRSGGSIGQRPEGRRVRIGESGETAATAAKNCLRRRRRSSTHRRRLSRRRRRTAENGARSKFGTATAAKNAARRGESKQKTCLLPNVAGDPKPDDATAATGDDPKLPNPCCATVPPELLENGLPAGFPKGDKDPKAEQVVVVADAEPEKG